MGIRPVILVLFDSLAIVRGGKNQDQSSIDRIALKQPIVTLDVSSVESIVHALQQTEIPFSALRDATLVLPAHVAYTHPVAIRNRRSAKQAITFALEEFLPCSAEELICSALPIDKEQSLGIALPRAALGRLLEGISSLGIAVGTITLDVLVASKVMPNDESAGLLIRDGDRATAAVRNSGSNLPSRIRSAINGCGQSHANWLGRQTKLAQSDGPTEPNVWHVLDLQRDEGICETSGLLQEHAASVALEAAGLVGKTTADRLLNRLAITGLLAAAACLVLLARTHQSINVLEDVLQSIQTRQIEVFAESLPGIALPSNPAMRLASERLRLERMTGSNTQDKGNGLELTDPLAPLTQFNRFVEGLPESVRINIIEATIDDRQFSLRGQTRDHRSAERITDAVNQHMTWQARPPRTSRLSEGGVEFSLRARRETTNPASTR